MKFQAHRGVGTEFPENTLPAFAAAAAQGYDSIELDPVFTKDNHCVILHDATLNRTCRDQNGQALPHPVFIQELTLNEALQYDAGIAKADKFRGTKIPLLSEVLSFAASAGICVKLDNKIREFSRQQMDFLFDTVEKSGARVGFTVCDTASLPAILARFPKVEIHYDGPTDEESLRRLRAVAPGNERYIWLPLACPATSWAGVAKADESLCETVRQYGKLGLWILENAEELEQARRFRADIVETPGQIKPDSASDRLIFDCHTHTHFSHDSECDPRESLKNALIRGISGIAITDHCDIEYSETQDIRTPIFRSAECAKKLGSRVLAGVEIGEAIHNPEATAAITRYPWDLILGSVHAVSYQNALVPYSKISFSDFCDEEIHHYLSAYFGELLLMIQTTDFDVLSHLTCPLRYINGKYHRHQTLDAFSGPIDTILREIIRRGIALEINTSCLDTDYNAFMPDLSIVRRYRQLGGYLLTLGSDAHCPERVAYGFNEALRQLFEIGFPNIYFYRNRIPIPSPIRF